MKNVSKKFGAGLTIAVAAVVVAVALVVQGGSVQGKIQPYYTGDAAAYRNGLVVASVNSGALELFTVRGEALERTARLAVSADDGADLYYDVALSEENGRLYAYAVNGRYLLKFDVSNPATPELVATKKDNSWDWFMRVDRIADRVVTAGTKGTKLWNMDLQVVNAFDKAVVDNANATVAHDGSWYVEVVTDANMDAQDDYIRIVDGATHTEIGEFPIVLNAKRDRGVYVADDRDTVYVVGDRVVKQINAATGRVQNFSHISTEGYAAAGTPGSSHFYFTDGAGIVKMNHSMEAIDWLFARDMPIAGSWSMGMDVVTLNGAERIVVFNNTNIAVLDADLNVITAYQAPEKSAIAPAVANEPLSINLSWRQEKPGGEVRIAGTGFGVYEDVEIAFVKNGQELAHPEILMTDGNGRFADTIVVPVNLPQNLPVRVKKELPVTVEIRATGVTSGLTYGTSFKVIQ